MFESHPLTVKDGRGRKRGAANAFGNTIKFPKWTRRKWYIMHELAHIATDYIHNFTYVEDDEDGGGWPGYKDPETGRVVLVRNVAPHGPEFTGIYLYLLRGFLGVGAHDKLQAAFEETGVKVAPVEVATDEARTVEARFDTPTPPEEEPAVTDTDTRCLECGMRLSPMTTHKFCSDRCRWTFHNRRRHERTAAGREKTCEACGKEFVGARADAKTCSAACRQRARRQRQRVE